MRTAPPHPRGKVGGTTAEVAAQGRKSQRINEMRRETVGRALRYGAEPKICYRENDSFELEGAEANTSCYNHWLP